MRFFDTKHKRKSVKRTIVILILLLLLMFNTGMGYSDPPIEYGVAISTGNVGELVTMDSNSSSSSSSSSSEKNQIQENIVNEEPRESTAISKPITEVIEPSLTEDYVADQTSDKVADIKKDKNIRDTKSNLTDINQEKVHEVPKEIKEVKGRSTKHNKTSTKPRNFDEANKALSGLLSSNQGDVDSESQGNNSAVGGNKNKVVGGTGGSKYSNRGAGGNYQLSGRKALLKSKPKPDCEKEGVIVVEVVVNNQGKVIQARGIGIGCLQKAAETAAKKTRWNADPHAPRNQKGKIIYKFSLN